MRHLCFLAFAACAGPSASTATCATDLAGELDKLHVPGLAAGIVKHGALACTAVAGMADIEAGRPVTPDTLFELASTSKTVTATAIMSLVEDGTLALDDDALARVPFHVANPHCPGKPVTMRHLLTHTSSIVDNPKTVSCPETCGYGTPLENVTPGADSPVSLHDLLASYLVPGGALYDATANFDATCPGSVASYSNMGVTLAGYIAEVASGVPFDQLTRERVFEPLGMTETSWRLATIDPAHLAMPYDFRDGHYVPYGQYGYPDYPDGALRSSVTELAKFLAMYTQGGELGGHRVLAASTIAEMARPQIEDLDEDQGLIWFYNEFPGRPTVFGHDGSDLGVSTYMFYDPRDGAGVILLSNGMWYDATGESPAADELMGKLFAESIRY